MDLKLKPKERLATSTLFKGFQKARLGARFEVAKKGVGLTSESRVQILDHLLGSSFIQDPEEKGRVSELLIIKSILLPGLQEDKLVYLLEDS